MIQIFADGVLTYDSRLEDYDLQGLVIKSGLNKGGTAEITMPAFHPAYSAYQEYKTTVEIYRDGALRFRGRALYPEDNFDINRKVVCEGELCFFLDSVSRPYLYQGAPAEIFAAVVAVHNSQVEEARQFKVGTVTVTDANDYIRLESGTAEKVHATLTKLLERCGGYFIFTTDTDGARVINWLESVGTYSGQTIEFGENLLDFVRRGANTDLATAILPYGAQDEETGERVTIESVNDGVDYIKDEAAAALRGTIFKIVTWDDVTEPANLLRKAWGVLESAKLLITTLDLTALDLSYYDKSIDSFDLGDQVRVISKPHAVDEFFQLTDRTEDLLYPDLGSVTFGKEKSSLTGADVEGDNKSQSELHKVTEQVRKEYTLNIATAVQSTQLALSTLIQQTSESILLEVSETYTTNEQLTEAISTRMTQLEDQFLFEFETLKGTVEDNNTATQERLTEIYNYIRFEEGNIILGGSDSPITLTLEKDLIVFKKNGQRFGWWDGVDFHTGNIVVNVNERAQFGNFAFVPRSNGSLSFLKVGEY